MIAGQVTAEGEPVVSLSVGGTAIPAVVDTGFNGDLQLPDTCRGLVTATFAGRVSWLLADNQRIEEDTYLVRLPFDGDVVAAMVSFAPGTEILMGTHFLRKHRLTVDFVAGSVLLEKA